MWVCCGFGGSSMSNLWLQNVFGFVCHACCLHCARLRDLFFEPRSLHKKTGKVVQEHYQYDPSYG